MVASRPRRHSFHFLRPLIAVAAAFALLALLLHAFAPARVALGEAAAVGLAIDKQGPNTIGVDEVITYTIRVTNTSASPLNNVVITDTYNIQLYDGAFETDLPGVTLILVTGPTKYAQFNLGTLPAGVGGYIRLPMVVTPAYQPRHNFGPTTFGNSVVVTTTTPGIQDAFDNADTLVVGPVLRLSKTYTPTNPRPGRLLTYTFLIENLNRSDAITATNIVITEQLPQRTIFYTAYPASIWYFDPGPNVVTWYLTETLLASSTTYVTVTVRVTPTINYKQAIENKKGNCGIYADGAPENIPCVADVNVTPDEIVEKVTEATIPPAQFGTVSRTFPNRIVTYTVFVYNPFDTPVTGLLVTDTLPHKDFRVTQTFQYSGLLSASTPTLPSVISQSSRIVAWSLPQIEAWGLYTFSFRAYVPPQMPVDDNQPDKEYQNALIDTYGDLNLTPNPGAVDQSMKIDVVPQVRPFKTVTPTQQMFGLPVTYTLVISNSGPTTLTQVAVTDVLPLDLSPGRYCNFTYIDTITGTQPRVGSGNIVAWDPITIEAYSTYTLATYRATVIGGPGQDCYNTVEGYSPDTYFVRYTNLAVVKVLVPFGVDKTVNPSKVVLGDSVTYSALWTNLGTIAATMNGFTDVLPAGFYASGRPVYTDFTGMPLVLQPNQANSYQRDFPVQVISTSIACDTLPQPVRQLKGTPPVAPGQVQMYVSDPPALRGLWSNAADLAPLEVHPQARLFKSTDPPGALPGEVVTFTLTLSNNRSTPIGNVALTDTLPNGFVFITGTDNPTWSLPDVRWTGLTIPGGGTRAVVFTALAPTATGTYFNNAKAASTSDALICIPKIIPLAIPVKRGEIEVNKLAAPREVNPLGRFDYQVLLKNIGPYTVTIHRFTDTLPGVPGHIWKYDGMIVGPPPASTNPPAWTNLTIARDQTLQLRFYVRADAQVGSYPNTLTQIPLAGYLTASLPAKWVLTASQNFTGTPVTVLPGVGLVKEASTGAAFAGDPVVYTITLVNVSGNTINNVRVTDTLPSGFTYEAMLAGPNPASTSPLVWTIPAVLNGEANKLVLAFRARISATQPTGTYYNQVSASATNIFIAPTGNIAPVAVSGIPSLNLSKTVAPGSVIAGRSVTYTLTLENPDDEDVIGARITDTLPSGFAFAQMVSGPSPASTSPQIVWTGINVSGTTTQTLSFRAVVSAGLGDGTYYNRVEGSSPQLVFQPTGPTAPVIVVATPSFDVQVSKSDGAVTATIGGSTVYTIRYTNTLNTLLLAATNVVLTETFSPAAYLNADAPGWNLVAPGVYTRFIGDVPAGASGQVTFGLQIDPGIPPEYWAVTNTVRIGADPPGDVPEAVEQPASNNASSDIDTIRGADIVVLGLSVLTSNPMKGSPIDVVVTVRNQGVDPTLGPDSLGRFGTDLYIKPANSLPPAGPDDRYLGACPTITSFCDATIRWSLFQHVKNWVPGDGMAAGETYVITFTHTLENGGLQWLFAQADTFWGDGQPASGTPEHGRILEPDEANNIFGPVALNVPSDTYLPLVLKNK